MACDPAFVSSARCRTPRAPQAHGDADIASRRIRVAVIRFMGRLFDSLTSGLDVAASAFDRIAGREERAGAQQSGERDE
jgi:hypothetical protein